MDPCSQRNCRAVRAGSPVELKQFIEMPVGPTGPNIGADPSARELVLGDQRKIPEVGIVLVATCQTCIPNLAVKNICLDTQTDGEIQLYHRAYSPPPRQSFLKPGSCLRDFGDGYSGFHTRMELRCQRDATEADRNDEKLHIEIRRWRGTLRFVGLERTTTGFRARRGQAQKPT